MSRTIRVSDETYKKLCEYAGKLQAKFKRVVSIDEAIQYLMKMAKINIISDLAGSWDVTDEEYEDILSSLRRGWSKWRSLESV